MGHIEQGSAYHRFDRLDLVTDRGNAVQFAVMVKEHIQAKRLVLPASSTYAALGAGQAVGERAFAEELGIPEERVTLVDKSFSPVARRRLAGFGGEVVTADFFDWLHDPKSPKFDVVTAFGLDYRMQDPTQADAVISGLSKRINPGGVGFVLPTEGVFNFHPLWKRHGFNSLGNPRDTDYYLMQLQ